MDILYLAHRIPYPPDKGDKLRSYREVEHLARRYRVWCACFVDDAADEVHIEPLRAFCHDVAAIRLWRTRAKLRGLAGLLGGRTITESFYSHPRMWETLRRWSGAVDFDAVVAFSSSMAPYALSVPAGRRILDLCDLDSQKWLDYAAASRGIVRPLYAVEGGRLAAAERRYLGAFDATLVITEAEAEPLKDAEQRGKLHIVGNGVVLPELTSDENGARHGSTNGRGAVTSNSGGEDSGTPNTPVVGFVGVMDYRPNVEAVCWFVANCWGRIRRAFPGVTFRIIGRSPTRRVRKLVDTPGVEVVGGVPDAMAQVQAFDVSVAPMLTARGLQNKVLEAMAAARPIVLTSLGAEGIDARNGDEFLIRDEPQEFAESVVRLLHDPVERRRLGKNARRFVVVNHCWEEHMRRLELIVTGALVRNTPRRRVKAVPTAVPVKNVTAVAAV